MPQVDGLPAALVAGASVELVVSPLPQAARALGVTVAGLPITVSTTDSGLTFNVPDTLNGLVAVVLTVDGDSAWGGEVEIAGFIEQYEASQWVGGDHWNLVTSRGTGLTSVWGAVAGNGLGRITLSSGAVAVFDSLLDQSALRVPGPTAVPGEWLIAPVAAVAVDSLEVWGLSAVPAFARRVPRHGSLRQAALLDADTWLRTWAHGLDTFSEGDSTPVFSGFGYEDPQVIAQSPAGDRTTITFLPTGNPDAPGTPVFAPSGMVAYHIWRMRAAAGVAFTSGGTEMVVVGRARDLSGLLMEVVTMTGAGVDSLTLSYLPRGVALDTLGRVYVVGEGAAGRPFVDVFERPGYRRIGRMQAPPAVRACVSQCSDAVIGFDLANGRVYAVDAGPPSDVGGSGNGIWVFKMPPGSPATSHRVLLR